MSDSTANSPATSSTRTSAKTKKPYRPTHLSASSAGTFRNCNRRWKLRYIDDLPDPPGEPAMLGTFVHKVLEDLLELPAQERTLDNAQQICTRNWPATEKNKDFKALNFDDGQKKVFKWKAWDFVSDYFQMLDPSKVEVVEREQRLRGELEGENGTVPFSGIVDLLERADDGLRVTDYKTGKVPSARFVDDSLSQVWLYAAALQKPLAEDGKEIASVQLFYIGNGKGRRGRAIVRPMDKAAMEWAVDRHRETWNDLNAAIESGDFAPTPGPLCGWCPYREHCPEGQEEYERRNGRA